MGASRIDYAGYRDCVSLRNADVEVILGPHCGGRVLAYAWHDENALALSPQQDGWTYEGQAPPLGTPSGGRFDIGPEMTIPPHTMLWLGPWEAEITGPGSARMTSVVDEALGVQLTREFELAEAGSRLTCTQTIHNLSGAELHTCHWSRTFGAGHGICVVPLSPHSRFPSQYIQYEPGGRINCRPEDPSIEVRDGVFLLLDTPKHPKLGLDSTVGWFAYLMPNDLMLVKSYPTYPDRVYGEMAGLTISLWYMRDLVCELEPIGPREILPTGASASFTETWYLTPYAFPDPRGSVDPVHVAKLAKELMKA